MAEIVQSLFGMTPGMYQQAQQNRIDAQALQYAQLDPFQQANYAIGRGASGLAGAVGGLLGGQDPELQRITARQQIAQQINPNDPNSIQQGIMALQQAGDTQGAMMLQSEYQKMQESRALTGQRQAAERKAAAQTSKIELSVEQETKLRNELSKLPTDATEADIRGVLLKYGDPDKVIASLTSAATRAEELKSREELAGQAIQAKKEAATAADIARADAAKLANDARIEAARIQAEARVDAARESGANRLQIANLQAQNKRDLTELTAALKGPSPAVLKAQEKAEKMAEGQEVLSNTVETAKTLVKDLTKTGGMTTTSKGPLSNLITSLGTGTIGQTMGRVTGTETQSKRDQLKSIRLQLLNAVAEATGTTSSRLNSNVELKTWLDSLGSEGMTQEANLAILNNIANNYLKKGAMAASVTPPVATTAPAGGGWNIVKKQ